MKVKDLIVKLQSCDPNSEIEIVRCPIHDDPNYVDVGNGEVPTDPCSLYIHDPEWYEPPTEENTIGFG